MTTPSLIEELVKALESADRVLNSPLDGSYPAALVAKIRMALSHAHAAQSEEPDHIYNPDDWECTYPWDDRSMVLERCSSDVVRLATLYDGPDWFAARDEDGSWNFFRTREEAEAAHQRYSRALDEDYAESAPPSKQEGA